MTQVSKNDVNQIFGSNAPDQDKPASFSNYTYGWGSSRSNNGKPTIVGFNFLQQRTDQNLLWIHQNGGALPYDESIDYVEGSIVLKDGKLQQLKSGVWVAYGSSDSNITTWTGNSQADENKKFVTTVNSYSELSSLETVDGRSAIVKGGGSYYYSDTQKAWIKDEPFAVYDFKTEQPIQYYYDLLGNWDDAILQAQINMYTLGYSATMVLPAKEIVIKRPIMGCAALGMYLHEKHPYLNIYNSETNTFSKTVPLIIKGQGRDATTIRFAGSKGGLDTPDDLTWVNYGAIHTAPYDVLGQCSGDAKTFYHTNYWTRVNLSGFTLYGYNRETNSEQPCCHGIVLFRGTRGFISDVVVNCFNGAGLLCDGYYDSFFEKFEIFQCGRMSPVYEEYETKQLTSIDYQTYAPLHIMRSDIGDGWDNCNFLRFLNFHVEDNYNAVADIIVTGDSSPIWIENIHFECDQGRGVARVGNRAVIALGGYGVSKFAQDGASGYVFGSEKFTGSGGGYAYWTGGAGYSLTYDAGIVLGSYAQLNLTDLEFPNGLNVTLNGGNAPAKLKASKCSFGRLTNIANAAAIVMTDCSAISYTQNYGTLPIMNNVTFSEFLKFENAPGSMQNRLVLNNVTCSYATGLVEYGNINLTSTSTTQGTTLYTQKGTSTIYDNYVINSVGGV